MGFSGSYRDRKFRAVVHLFNPPIDKAAAQAVVEIAQGGNHLAIEDWYGENTCPDAQLQRWEAAGVLPIDIGSEKYHGKAGSATEFVIRKLGIRRTPAINRLIQVLDENNRTGYLKGATLSVAYVMRELYESEEYDAADVVARAVMVVKTWLWDHSYDPLEGRDDAAFEAEPGLTEIRDATRGDYCDFTVGQYARALWRSGRSVPAISEAARFWIAGCTVVGREMAEAQNFILRDHAQNPDEFEINVPNGKLWGRWIETTNSRVTKAASRNYDVVVVRHAKRGHVSIMTDGLDVSLIFGELIRREPDCWVRSGGAVINGGRMYRDVKPTEGTKDGFIWMVRSFPPLVPHGKRIRHGRN